MVVLMLIVKFMMIDEIRISWESQDHVEANSRNSAHNCRPTLWHIRLGARGERQSHPLTGQAPAHGRLTTAEGLEGPIRDRWKLPKKKKLEAEGAAMPTLPPTILIIEGNRSGRADGHQEPRVIPLDHSRTCSVFEEFLQAPQPQGSQRLNTAHKQPIGDDGHFQPSAGLRGVLAYLRDGL